MKFVLFAKNSNNEKRYKITDIITEVRMTFGYFRVIHLEKKKLISSVFVS